jgi:16S rRNA (guanine527-N7)-methyltransferase
MDIINHYFPNLSPTQKVQFGALQGLYADWNAKINVISRTDVENLFERHVLHSLAIAKFIEFKPGTEILDVGTGGGFPGIPLAIMFPECQFHLIDSIGKKITVVTEVANALGLKNVKAEQVRAEQLRTDYEFIVCRAVTQLPVFFEWVRGKITQNNYNTRKNGLICLKGGDLTEELKAFGRRHKVYDLSSYYQEEFFETKKIVYVPAS